MISFIPHAVAGTVPLLTPREAVLALSDAFLGADTRDEPVEFGSSRDREIGAFYEGLQYLLHDRAQKGSLTVLTQPAGVETLYRVPTEYWKGFGEIEGGFSTCLFFFGLTAVDRRFNGAPVFYAREDITRLADDPSVIAALPIPSGAPVAPKITSTEREDECKRAASLLDAEDVSIRDVDAAAIARHWNPAKGKQAKIGSVTAFMTGGARGRAKKRRDG